MEMFPPEQPSELEGDWLAGLVEAHRRAPRKRPPPDETPPQPRRHRARVCCPSCGSSLTVAVSP